MCKSKLNNLWNEAFNDLCDIIDNGSLSKGQLAMLLNLTKSLEKLQNKEMELRTDMKDTLTWMVKHLEWSYREQKGLPEGIEIELSPEMKKARELLEELQ